MATVQKILHFTLVLFSFCICLCSTIKWELKEVCRGQRTSSIGNEAIVLIKELLQGPLQTSPIMVYFDENITPSKITEISQLTIDHPVTINIVTYENVEDWMNLQTKENLLGSPVIHIFFMDDDFETFIFESMKPEWNPKYLIIFNLGRDSASYLFENESISGIRNVILVQNLSNLSNYTLLSYEPFSETKKLVILGKWCRHGFSTIDDLFPDRFPSFSGHEFQISSWNEDQPYLYRYPDSNGTWDGVSFEMLTAFGHLWNFTYTFTDKSSDGKWGSFDNGTWTGMLGMVHRKEKLFTVNSMAVNYYARLAFENTVTYWTEGFSLVMLAPPPVPKWSGSYYPFDKMVWGALVGTIVIAIVFLALLNQFGEERFLLSNWDAWIAIIRSSVNNSWPKLPETSCQQVFAAFWFIFCMVIIYAYTANLLALLTVPVYPKRIQTVQELAESNFGVTKNDYGDNLNEIMGTSADEYFRIIGKRMEMCPTETDALVPVFKGTHAYIEASSYGRIIVGNRFKEQSQNVYWLKEQLYNDHLSWFFQKNTAFVYKFNFGIQSLVEAGLIKRWHTEKTEDFLGKDWQRKKLLQDNERGETILSLEHLQGAFLLLILLEGLALLVFFAELLAAKKFQKV